MPPALKAIHFLLNSILPEDLQDSSRTYDSKSISTLMRDIARRYPDRYEELSQKIADIGRNASYHQGESLLLDDLKPVIDKHTMFAKMDADVAQAKKDSDSPEEFEQARNKIWIKNSDDMERMTQKEALSQGNNLAYSVVSGARGKPAQLKAMLTTPGIFEDYKGGMVPMFIRHSFGEGLRPAEYLASTAGTRKSVISTKSATAKGGDQSKIMVQAAAPLIVTAKDCGASNGVELPIEENSLRGRVLARNVDGVKAGQLLDEHTLAQLRHDGIKSLVARSSQTCQARDGVCAKCVGQWAGKFPHIGDSVGITAAQSIGEPITQMALNCISKGTEVRMADFSVKTIEEIQIGDWVLGADITGRTFPVTVTKRWDQGMQPVQDYSFRMGQTNQYLNITCTAKHVMLVNKKVVGASGKNKNWTSPKNLIPVKLPAGYPHKKFGAVLPNAVDVPGQDEKFAGLCGVLLGDGNRVATQKDNITLSCADMTQIDALNATLAVDNLKVVKCTRSHDWRIVQAAEVSAKQNEKGQFEKGYRHPLRVKLEHWNLLGKYAHEKTLPPDVLGWTQRNAADLISGFIATDGSVYKNADGHVGISFASCSKPLLEGLKELLRLRLCVYSSALTCTGKAGTGNRNHDRWQFTVTRQDQVRQLAQHLNIPGVKHARVHEYLDSVTYQTRNPEPFYWAQRKSIEEKGIQHCFDISVDHPEELFVLANGLIVKNSKHTAGMASGRREFSGFDVISQFTASPETFPDRAAVAEEDGEVTGIEKAPQGGHYIHVNDKSHYVLPGYELMVKHHDKVEAGDQLSDGLVDPGDIIRLRGLGEGRQYYADRLSKILSDSGMPADRRNVEMLSRAALNHVVIDDPEGMSGALPDDVVSYNKFLHSYNPPEDTKSKKPHDAIGEYLQAPALHYTIGTKITKRVADHLAKNKYDIHTSPTEPKFRPEMTNLRTASHYTDENEGGGWLGRQHTSYIKKNLNDDAIRGSDTNVEKSVHFTPRLAIGTDFGKNIEQTGRF